MIFKAVRAEEILVGEHLLYRSATQMHCTEVIRRDWQGDIVTITTAHGLEYRAEIDDLLIVPVRAC